MVILEDTDTHTLVSRYFPKFRNIDIILIFHAHRLLVCLIVAIVHHDNRHFGINQFLNGGITQTASFGSPKMYTDRQFTQIPLSGPFRQGRKQEVHKLPPGVPFRKFHHLPSHSVRTAIHTGEVHAIHPSYHLPPGVRVKHPVERQTLLRFIDERACYPLTFQIDSGTIIQVIQYIIVPLEFSVCRPHIRRLPVEDGIGIIDVISDL